MKVYLTDGKNKVLFKYDEQFQKLTSLTRGLFSEPRFLILNLIESKDPVPLGLLFKGMIRKIFLRGSRPSLTQNEYRIIFNKLQNQLIKFTPNIIIVENGESSLNFQCSQTNLVPQLIMIKEIIFDNQYGINKEKISGKIVIDAGGNVGIFSIYAASLGASRVYTFEPVTNTINQLISNVALNSFEKIVIPVNAALGEKPGLMQIGFRYTGDWGASNDFDSQDDSISTQHIEIITLDEYMKNRENADFIKIDVEGMEAKVLNGSKTVLSHANNISAEIHSQDLLTQVRQQVITSGFQETENHEIGKGVYLVQWNKYNKK